MKPIKILLLEDNPDDAELCLHYLWKAGHEVLSEVTADRREFQSLVVRNSWDIVIADYNLGQFTALDAIEFCCNHQIEIPFIVLTGVGSEQLAVESLRHGALDYLSKDDIRSISHRVEHALHEWRQRQEIKRLHQRIQELAKFPENDPNLVLRIEPSGKIAYKNPAAQAFLKRVSVPEEEILSILPLDFNKDIRPLIGSAKIIRGQETFISDTHLRFTFSSFADVEAILVTAEDITLHKRAEEELERSEARYRAIFDTNQDVMIVTDTERRIIDINEEALRKVFGYGKEEVLGKSTAFLYPDTEAFQEFGKTFYHSGRAGFTGTTLKRKSGETFPAETIVTEISDDQDNIMYFLEVHRDISDAVTLRKVFREKMAIEMILAGSPIAMFIIDESHTITHWNRVCEEITGFPAQKMVGTKNQWMPFYDHKRPVAADYIIQEQYERMLQDYSENRMKPSGIIKGAWEMERYYQSLGGQERYIHFTVSPITDEQGKIIAAIEIMQDISDRKRAEEENRLLSRRLISIAEEERKKLARDLHDELGQAVTALHFGMEVLEHSLPSECDNQKKKCGELTRLVERIGDATRNIISELRPAMLDHLGLLPTLEWYIDDFSDRHQGLHVNFQATGVKQRLDAETETVVYRIIQEGLNNIAKHAGATQVNILLTYSHPNIILTIKDNGVGFEQKQDILPSRATRRGVGLLGMPERAASVGGQLEIRSRPGKGTVIRAKLPVTGSRSNV
jgi:PAS domain S-box-containing protein